MPRILLLDDDIAEITAVKRLVARTAHRAQLATTAADAAGAIERDPPDLLVIAAACDGGRALSLARDATADGAPLPVLVLGDAPGLPAGVRVLGQPIDPEQLGREIEGLLRTPRRPTSPSAPAAAFAPPAASAAPTRSRAAGAEALRTRAAELLGARAPAGKRIDPSSPPSAVAAGAGPVDGAEDPRGWADELAGAEAGWAAPAPVVEAEIARSVAAEREAAAVRRAASEAARERAAAEERRAAQVAAEREADASRRASEEEERLRAAIASARAELEVMRRRQARPAAAPVRSLPETPAPAAAATGRPPTPSASVEAPEQAPTPSGARQREDPRPVPPRSLAAPPPPASAVESPDIARAPSSAPVAEPAPGNGGAGGSVHPNAALLARPAPVEPAPSPSPDVAASPEHGRPPSPDGDAAPEHAGPPSPDGDAAPEHAAPPAPDGDAAAEHAAPPAPDVDAAPEHAAPPSAEGDAAPERAGAPSPDVDRPPEHAAPRSPAVAAPPEHVAPPSSDGGASRERAARPPSDAAPSPDDVPPSVAPAPSPEPAPATVAPPALGSPSASRPPATAAPGPIPPLAAPAPPRVVPPAAPSLPPPPEELRSGTLSELPAPRLLALAAGARLAGRVDLDGEVSRSLWFEAGRVVGATSGDPAERVEALAVRLGLVTRDQHQQIAERAATLPARRAALLLLDAGFLKPAELSGLVRRRTEEVVFGIFGDAGARFRWVSDDVPADERGPVERPALALAVEGVRRRWSASRLDTVLGGPDTILSASPDGPPAEALALSPEERQVAQLADGLRTLAQIERASPLEALATRQALAALVQVGALAVRRLAPRSSAESGRAIDRARLADKVDQARRCDYFTVLGLPRSSTSHEVREAAGRLEEDLDPRRHADGGDPALTEGLGELLQVVRDARAVLGDDRLRQAYLAALGA